MKNFNLLIIAFFSIASALAQSGTHKHINWCGKNYYMEKLFEKYPEARFQAQQDSIALAEHRRNFSQQKDGDPYIIPVVFHIVHTNGSENISDQQIHSAIDEMNADFSASNVDFGQTISAFEGIAANVGIEFQLARLDPDGNCTNGINRVYDEATDQGDEDEIKDGDASTWGNNRYLNIWVVKSLEGNTVAYSRPPSNAPWFSSIDGIVCSHNHVGSIGTSNAENRHTLAHEVGHWLSLDHPWGSSNTPGLSSNCLLEDGIEDTPETIGWFGVCDLDGATCGSLDNVQNHMDYSFCTTMFTQGQATQMVSALTSSVAGRSNLWSANNLEDAGLLAPAVVCAADFTTEDDRIICPGGEVEFIDLSFNGVTERQWIFEGGTPSNSTATNPAIVYDNPGTYEVTLTASNENGSESVTKSDFITVLPLGENSLPFQEDFESFTSLESNEENWFIENGDNTNVKWQITTDASVSGSNSIFVNGRQNPFADASTEVLISPTFDLSEVTSEDAFVTFKYAHARRFTSSEDELQIFISSDCGETWSLRETLDIDELPTVDGTQSEYFIPDSEDDWSEAVIDNVSSFFQNDSFRMRFVFHSFRGNNLFLDDINVFDPATVGLDNIDFVNVFRVYPNPTIGATTLEYTLNSASDLTIDIVDLSGRVVQPVFSGNQPAGQQIMNLDAYNLQSGIYLLRMQSQGQQIIRKLVRQ